MPENHTRDFITIVSGLPRSGTSMMMRMLDAGGIPVFADGDRLADADNPNGYYEYEPIKKLNEDSSWVANAVGHAIKAIYLLLYQLPKEYSYRVVFMRRDLPEVIASQDTMLRRSGAATGSMDPRVLARHFETQLRQVDAWLRQQPNMSVLDVPYAEVVRDPQSTAVKVAAFLGETLDVDKMVASVDPALYRNRATAAGRG
jgi:hypothetical protein